MAIVNTENTEKTLNVTGEQLEEAVTKLGEIEAVLGTETLPTTAQTIKGAIAELYDLIQTLQP